MSESCVGYTEDGKPIIGVDLARGSDVSCFKLHSSLKLGKAQGNKKPIAEAFEFMKNFGDSISQPGDEIIISVEILRRH